MQAKVKAGREGETGNAHRTSLKKKNQQPKIITSEFRVDVKKISFSRR